MKARIEKDGSSILKVLIDVPPENISEGTIELRMVVDKGDSTPVATQPYTHTVLSYEFRLSGSSPYNIGDYDYIIRISDGIAEEKSRILKMFDGLPSYLRGALKKIRRDFEIISKQYNGSIVYLFKRLPSKEHCPVCWDNDLRSSSNSNCPTCGGTGFITYYTSPYKTYAGPLHFSNETFSTDDTGKTAQGHLSSVATIASFILTENDMLYYDKTKEWYRVKARTVSELRNYPVLQTFTVSLMPSTAPEVEVAKKYLKDAT